MQCAHVHIFAFLLCSSVVEFCWFSPNLNIAKLQKSDAEKQFRVLQKSWILRRLTCSASALRQLWCWFYYDIFKLSKTWEFVRVIEFIGVCRLFLNHNLWNNDAWMCLLPAVWDAVASDIHVRSCLGDHRRKLLCWLGPLHVPDKHPHVLLWGPLLRHSVGNCTQFIYVVMIFSLQFDEICRMVTTLFYQVHLH